MDFEDRFIEHMANLPNGRAIAEDFIKFVKSQGYEGLSELYAENFRKIGKICDDFIKAKGLNISLFDLIDALKKAREDIEKENVLRGAIPAILTGPGGNVDSEAVKNVKKKLKNK